MNALGNISSLKLVKCRDCALGCFVETLWVASFFFNINLYILGASLNATISSSERFILLQILTYINVNVLN